MSYHLSHWTREGAFLLCCMQAEVRHCVCGHECICASASCGIGLTIQGILCRNASSVYVCLSLVEMSGRGSDEQEAMDTGTAKDAEESAVSGVQLKFEEICQGLNLDKQAQEKAWDSYVRLSEKYGLEVRA